MRHYGVTTRKERVLDRGKPNLECVDRTLRRIKETLYRHRL